MTLLIGIKTNTGLDRVVLASDRQLSEYEEGAFSSKRPIRKIYSGDFWAMGDAGGDDQDVRRFYRMLRGHKGYGSGPEQAKRMIKVAIKERRFHEVRELNTELMRTGENIDIEDTHAFLLAVNSPRIGLWLVDEFGNIKDPPKERDFDYLLLGNGKKEAEGYIQRLLAEEQIDRDRISTRTALSVVRGALKAAEKKADVGFGYDVVVVSKKGVEDLGREIGKSVASAERAAWRNVENKYNGPDESE